MGVVAFATSVQLHTASPLVRTKKQPRKVVFGAPN